MEKYNKIHWAKGLDITPETFIAADNYHIAERSLLGRVFASGLYGILPERKFNIRKKIVDYTLTIEVLECLAITPDGYVIDIQSDTPLKKEVSLKEATGTELYVILKVNPYSTTLVDEKKLYVYPEYIFEFERTEETIETGIPIFKIYYDNDDQCWEIVPDYIPPSTVLISVDTLRKRYSDLRNALHPIIEKLPENNMIAMQVFLLQWEMDNYSLQESPQKLTLLLKKICWLLKLYLKSEKGIDDLPYVKKFMEERYNHNDVEKALRLGFECLTEIDKRIDEKPKEVAPKPEEFEITINKIYD